jgi:hypothetical protein
MKLTLSLDQDLIEFAHRLAKESGDSVSNMVAAFLRHARKTRQGEGPAATHPAVASLYGRYRKKPLPEKGEMKKRLLRKHLG